MRADITGRARINFVVEYQSCMVSNGRLIPHAPYSSGSSTGATTSLNINRDNEGGSSGGSSSKATAARGGGSSGAHNSEDVLRVRFHIIRNARIENVGKYQSCMVSK